MDFSKKGLRQRGPIPAMVMSLGPQVPEPTSTWEKTMWSTSSCSAYGAKSGKGDSGERALGYYDAFASLALQQA